MIQKKKNIPASNVQLASNGEAAAVPLDLGDVSSSNDCGFANIAKELEFQGFWDAAWGRRVKSGDHGKQVVARYEKLLLRKNLPDGAVEIPDPRPLEAVDWPSRTSVAFMQQIQMLLDSRWALILSGRKLGVGEAVDKRVSGVR